MSEFVGNLTEDIGLLSGDAAPPPAESWGSLDEDIKLLSSDDAPTSAETTDTQDAKATQAEENKPLNNSPAITTPQNYEPPSEQETTALDSGLMEFWRGGITEALPQLRSMDAGEKEQIIGKVNFGIFQEMHADKRFMASLEKSYDGSRQSLQRGAMLLAEKWLRALPYAIGKLNLPKPLTQSEADRMQPIEILNSGRFGMKRKPWRPESIFDSIGRSKPQAAGARR